MWVDWERLVNNKICASRNNNLPATRGKAKMANVCEVRYCLKRRVDQPSGKPKELKGIYNL
jgi:hypothetical protein